LSKSFKLLQFSKTHQRQMLMTSQRGFAGDFSNEPAKRIAVTGAAGNIAYSILYRLASGEFLGKK